MYRGHLDVHDVFMHSELCWWVLIVSCTKGPYIYDVYTPRGGRGTNYVRMSEEGEESWVREMWRHIIYCYPSYMTIGDENTGIKLCRTFLSQISTQCIWNVLTYNDIDLENKAIEIHHEWSKAGEEIWSHIPISFNYGHISTLILYKDVNFVLSEIIKQCIANERNIDAYLSYSKKNLSSSKNEIRHGCCTAHLIKFEITLTLPTESTILYRTTVEGLTF